MLITEKGKKYFLAVIYGKMYLRNSANNYF